MVSFETRVFDKSWFVCEKYLCVRYLFVWRERFLLVTGLWAIEVCALDTGLCGER
jgi:hypothetical protein